jgi:3'-phosphoadenosine 5'-phosphosulfate (PAPS) 3'-phosphatase
MAMPGPKPSLRQAGRVRCELGSAVKFGRVAEGAVDIYPRLSPTSDWDVAAGQAVVAAAGGKITDSSGAALVFGAGRKDFIVPEFIAWGDPNATASDATRAHPLLQRSASAVAFFRKRAGSAANASRFSSRPNR